MPQSVTELSATKKAAVVAAIQAGNDIHEVAEKFGISVSSISGFVARLRRRGWVIRYAYHRGRGEAQTWQEVERLLGELGLKKQGQPYLVRPLKARRKK
jgi:transposase